MATARRKEQRHIAPLHIKINPIEGGYGSSNVALGMETEIFVLDKNGEKIFLPAKSIRINIDMDDIVTADVRLLLSSLDLKGALLRETDIQGRQMSEEEKAELRNRLIDRINEAFDRMDLQRRIDL